MLLHACVAHTSLQSFDPLDQGLSPMKRSVDIGVSMSIKIGLEMGLEQPLATSVLVGTYTRAVHYLNASGQIQKIIERVFRTRY